METKLKNGSTIKSVETKDAAINTKERYHLVEPDMLDFKLKLYQKILIDISLMYYKIKCKFKNK